MEGVKDEMDRLRNSVPGNRSEKVAGWEVQPHWWSSPKDLKDL